MTPIDSLSPDELRAELAQARADIALLQGYHIAGRDLHDTVSRMLDRPFSVALESIPHLKEECARWVDAAHPKGEQGRPLSFHTLHASVWEVTVPTLIEDMTFHVIARYKHEVERWIDMRGYGVRAKGYEVTICQLSDDEVYWAKP